jgi:hypothetical protein
MIITSGGQSYAQNTSKVTYPILRRVVEQLIAR